ncbi:MAG TPA: tetratricopeptide repeat protein [Thermoanaerobaculia bacterium]|nr:tetratricopeptide repeat protein [Thermoanaerobaculia bacterium]
MKNTTLLVLLLVSATLDAQAPPSFAKGVLAFEKKEWAAAEKLMREAVAGNPNEVDGTVRVEGQWFETYVPHYFLARALAKQGKCAEALKHFEESERQGVTPAIPDFARHLNTRGGCKPAATKPKGGKVLGEVVVPFGEEAPPTSSSAPKDPVTPKVDIRQRLSSAVKSYMHGRYDESLRVLASVQFEGAAAGEAALLRAASRHALYRIGGEKDAKLRALIDSDLREYHQRRPSARPDPRLFPPAFVAMASN